MEAKFQDSRFSLHNHRLQDTVQFIPIKSATEEFLETEISEDRLLVIDQESDNPVPIDILFQVNPTALRIAGICLNIANAPKCEIYTGNCLEYHSVDVGTKQDDMPELDVFKYELNFSQRLPSVISLKFKPTSAEVLIFGIDVFVCPAADQGASHSAGIDLRNVEEMLAESHLGISEAAERCKEFLKVSLNKVPEHDIPSSTVPDSGLLLIIDQKLKDMETRMMDHLDQRFREIMDRLDSACISTPSAGAQL